MSKVYLIHEAGRGTAPGAPPRLLGGLLCSEYQDVKELQARFRSGNFTLEAVSGPEALADLLSSDEARARGETLAEPELGAPAGSGDDDGPPGEASSGSGGVDSEESHPEAGDD